MEAIYDVAVIGYGPTGMTAAALLGQAGHRVIVIERWPGLYGLPRLTHMDDETARILQEVCDIDKALEDSTPTVYKWVNDKDEVLLRLPNLPGNQTYSSHMSIYQPDIETAVDARIRTLPNVELRQGWALVGLAQDAAGVTIEIAPFADRTLDLDRSETVRAAWVIGADGNKSVVREAIGATQTDYGFEETWVNLDMEWLRPRPEEYAISTQHCDPARGHMTMGIGTRRQRFEFAVLPGEDAAELAKPDAGWAWLKEVHGFGPEDLKFARQLSYTFGGRMTDSWRVGRVLLGGDAAHVMPPYLGQGACSGIRDASNLAFKLDLVLRGIAEDSLLDTYQEERAPHADAAIRGSIGLGHIANMSDPEAAALRDQAFLSGQMPEAPGLPALSGGALRDGDPLAGTLAPQGWLGVDGERLRGDDALRGGFQVITTPGAIRALEDGDRDLLAQIAASVLEVGGAIEDLDGVYGALLANAGVDIVVVRPDHIIFGGASAADASALFSDLRRSLALFPSREGVLT